MKVIAIAAGYALGVDPRRLALLIFSLAFPLPTLLMLGVVWWRARPIPGMESVIFCEGMAGELRSGSTVRMAIAASARSIGDNRLELVARSEATMSDLAADVAEAFPDVGPEIRAVIERAARLGGPVADLFDEIGTLALAQVEVRQEVASASAPARAAAVVLLLAPFVGVAWAVTRGGIAPYLQTPAQRSALLVGLVLTASGVVVGGRMLRVAK